MSKAKTPYQKVEDSIRQMQCQLASEGRLLPAEALRDEYTKFSDLFGPERLREIGGRRLLSFFRTDLPNWLKAEERTPGQTVFGELDLMDGRGLGLWFDEDEKCWMRFARRGEYVRGEQPHMRLTGSEALEVADAWRMQLRRAVDLVADLPEIVGDVVGQKLQDELEAQAPDVVGCPWGHKYLAMLFPGRIDQFHDDHWHSYMLIKCLEMPPRSARARPRGYLCAGRFARISRELQMPMNHLCLSLEALFGPPHPYWLLETTAGEWKVFTSQGFIDLGWAPSWDPSGHRCALAQLQWLARDLGDRDLIAAHHGRRVLGVARVNGPYGHDESAIFSHRRPIRTLDVASSTLPKSDSRQSTSGVRRASFADMLVVEEGAANWG